jgi:hypothetical protein
MERDVFFRRFHQAVAAACDFARTLIEEPLADDVLCRLYLNSSYDGNPLHEDETVFPEDNSPERCREVASLPVAEAAAELWRCGKVPEWVDVAVVARTDRYTVVCVRSCGRFTANDDLLYHVQEGWAPFHVVGPSLPLDYVQGKPFSIYYRSSCWTAEEFESASGHRSRPWSLELFGPAFGDIALAAAGPFPALEILELQFSPVRGPGLSGCSQMPRLRIIRINRHPPGEVGLSALPDLPKLENLRLRGLSDPPDLAVLESATPALTELAFAFAGTKRTLAFPRIDALTRVSITADHLGHRVQFPGANRVREVSIHGGLSDREVLAILEQLPSLTTVDLSGTQVTDQTVRFLSRYAPLSYVCLQNTKVSDAALGLFRAEHPTTRVHG